MAALKRLQWSVDIAAPASGVYQILVAPESHTKWRSAFGEGLYFKGSWRKGQTHDEARADGLNATWPRI